MRPRRSLNRQVINHAPFLSSLRHQSSSWCRRFLLTLHSAFPWPARAASLSYDLEEWHSLRGTTSLVHERSVLESLRKYQEHEMPVEAVSKEKAGKAAELLTMSEFHSSFRCPDRPRSRLSIDSCFVPESDLHIHNSIVNTISSPSMLNAKRREFPKPTH